ncbi:hypothetical protein MLD38_033762 [Melastoma candidum]|uniref:Uncharacterized protein n=1 Tax=Melastoma candidum TaxID=119954 RepID=A0ACB9M7S4_9MYRT|nr:hypothetical protein MLD38_033762 [Melastoma candidum]
MEGGGWDDDRVASNPRKRKNHPSSSSSSSSPGAFYHRHTPQQTQRLEEYFKECPHPDEQQRNMLSQELGMEPRQVKFWFQNKRTQTKSQTERADNAILRAENERIKAENLAMREALQDMNCPTCGGPPFAKERKLVREQLQLENAQLKEEHEYISHVVVKYLGRPIPALLKHPPGLLNAPTFPDRNDGKPRYHGNMLPPTLPSEAPATPKQFTEDSIIDMERKITAETTNGALEELIKLLRINEPLWIKSVVDGRYILARESYQNMFARPYHFKIASSRIESSKDTRLVPMKADDLAYVFINVSKWADMFHTLVAEARTVQVIEDGKSGRHHDHLQLVNARMHVLSPLVPPREFLFFRHCHRIDAGSWIIVDVSFDDPKLDVPPNRAWRLPSGCLIQDKPNGFSKVTWVEHVEVDDRNQTHKLFRDVVGGGLAYGAPRWTTTLQRMCDRLLCLSGDVSTPGTGGVVVSPATKKSMMNLTDRMMRNFCSILSMTGKQDFPNLSHVNSGVRLGVQKAGAEFGQPTGKVINAVTSLWLPFTRDHLFNFFCNDNLRHQWDVLCACVPAHLIARFPTGNHATPGNSISIIQPGISTESMVMIQETCTDSVVSHIVYTPVNTKEINAVLTVNTLISTTVQSIKAALKCPTME